MKQIAFAIGILALSVTAVAQAHADFAVIRFSSRYCRVWNPPAAPPQDFQYFGVSARLAGPPLVATPVRYRSRSRNGFT